VQIDSRRAPSAAAASAPPPAPTVDATPSNTAAGVQAAAGATAVPVAGAAASAFNASAFQRHRRPSRRRSSLSPLRHPLLTGGGLDAAIGWITGGSVQESDTLLANPKDPDRGGQGVEAGRSCPAGVASGAGGGSRSSRKSRDSSNELGRAWKLPVAMRRRSPPTARQRTWDIEWPSTTWPVLQGGKGYDGDPEQRRQTTPRRPTWVSKLHSLHLARRPFDSTGFSKPELFQAIMTTGRRHQRRIPVTSPRICRRLSSPS